MKKILFINNATSPDDRISWSGTSYQLIQALKRVGFKVDYLYALEKSEPSFLGKLGFTYWKLVKDVFHKNIRIDDSFYLMYEYKKTLSKFDYSQYDFIFVPTHTCIIAALPKNIKAKIVFIADAVVDSLFGYYSEFSNLIWQNYKEAHLLGKCAFKRSDVIIVSSNWCKEFAVNYYGIKSEKLNVVEFGANIDDVHIPICLPSSINKKSINIYWSGVNWYRKGGDIALACCEELKHSGYDVTFTITGLKQLPIECYDSNGNQKKYIRSFGFLNKNIDSDYKKLIDIMASQDIFIFPSRAECSSIALCEANGFGLPCFVYDTGGLANYVENGKNGYRLPIKADGKTFAHQVISCIEKDEMNQLSIGAKEMFKDKLNWNIWGEKVSKILLQS